MNKSLVAALASMVAVNAWAQDPTYDTRSLGMGGVGVASANTRNAVFQNPSMMTSKADDDVMALELPMVNVRLLDEKDLMTAANDLEAAGNQLTTALNGYQTAYNNFLALPADPVAQANFQTAAVTASSALNSFSNAMTGASGKEVNGAMFAGLMLGVPSKAFSFSVVADGRAELGARLNYAATDAALVTTLSTDITNCALAPSPLNPACNAASANTAGGNVNGLASTFEVRGVAIKEIGISMAHRFGDTMDVGITPKSSQLVIFDANSSAQQTNGVGTNNGAANETKASMFNMDLGISKQLSGDDKEGLRAGLVVKDMFSKTFKTVLGNDITFKPRMTAGVGYMTKLTTTAIDVDLVANKAMISGFSSDSQFIRLGAEFDAWSWAQFRIGYRHDLKNNYKGLLSAGMGISIFGLHMDVSAAAAGKSEASVAAQLGLHF